MVGLLLIGAAAAAALLFAAAARSPSLVSTLLYAYLAYVANLGIVTLVLSPVHEVTRGGLAVAEAVLLAGAIAAWRLRGRPGLPLAAARDALLRVATDPVTGFFLVVVAVLLAYELLLGLTVPPDNMDSLTYHLARAAAWAQHGGIYWIPNAPEVEMNAYQPLAEQQNLFLFAATGGGTLFALPQFLAELAMLVAVYGGARRLGFEVRCSACSAFLVAMFSVVALESMTAQNDLVAASFAAVASCLLLGGGGIEPAAAGAAIAFGLGTKLTAGLVIPVLAWLAFVRGRRVFVNAVAGGVVGLAALGMWGYVVNLVHTGHVLGAGTAAVQDRGSPSYPGSVANAFYLMYGLMDVSVLSNRVIHLLAFAGVLVGVALGVWLFRRGGQKRAFARGAGIALPFLAPLVVIGGAAVVAYIARVWGFPIRGSGGILPPLEENLNETYGHIANEDYSAFGPVGIVALVLASALTIRAYVLRRADARQLALACAFGIFLVLISLEAVWVPFLIRYFMLPAGIAAPLTARLFRHRVTTAAYLGVAALVIGLTVAHDQSKPLGNPYNLWRPWSLTWPNALTTNSRPDYAAALAAYDTLVPAHACVGAVLGTNEPSYLLFGRNLDHRVVFLPATTADAAAYRAGLFYVVVSAGAYPSLASTFTAGGWQVKPLGAVWQLAVAPHAGAGSC